jgi:hypothetical protein
MAHNTKCAPLHPLDFIHSTEWLVPFQLLRLGCDMADRLMRLVEFMLSKWSKMFFSAISVKFPPRILEKFLLQH